MTPRRARIMLWLTSAGLLAVTVAAALLHLMVPVEHTSQSDIHAAAPFTYRGTEDHPTTATVDQNLLKEVALLDFRQRLFDPPVVVPKPPPPKPLPQVQLLSTILRTGGEASAWVRDGQTTRKVKVGDVIGPENNPATVTAIQTSALVLDHEGKRQQITQNQRGTNGGRR